MSPVRTLLGLTASLVVLIATPVYRASAADRCSLKQVASLPATIGDGVIIDTKINGTSAPMYLGSGSAVSHLSEGFAKRIGLPIEEMRSGFASTGSRRGLNLMTHVGLLELGQTKSRSESFILTPDQSDGTDGQPVGTFAADYLANYDIEIDPVANKVVLWSQDHCRGQVVYWDKEYFAIPILFRQIWGDHVPELDVTVDGKPLRALISTSRSTTVVRQASAEGKLGWTVDSATTPKSGTWEDDDGRALDEYEHTTQSLTFGDITLHNFKVKIDPIDFAAHVHSTGSHISSANIEQPDIYIGMDLLKKFHIYFAHKEAMLYYTIATPPKQATVQ